jgi:hypothetical protein
MQFAKVADLVPKKWGKHTHVSKVVDKDSTPSEIKHLIKVAQTHTNYQCSMILKDIFGITNLYGAATIHDEETKYFLSHLSLCHVLLCFLCLTNGHQQIAEVHQSNEIMEPVQAVIPNTPETERMIVMMNKNVPAYIGNVLKHQGMPESFMMELVKNFCCPTQVFEICNCTWEPDTGTLTAFQEVEEEKTHVVLDRESIMD